MIARIDAAGPTDAICIEANLISLARIDPFETDLRHTDGERVAVNNSGYARNVSCLRSRTYDRQHREQGV
ncbi:MAG: hypothetical protein WBW99_18040 [Pseudolabrys sp.]